MPEARAHARIEHPNVVRVFDFEVTKQGEQLLVMELLEGIDLDARIRRDGPLSLVDARILATKACAALEAAHEAHVVHRDVKAENLFLVGGSVEALKLIDFGIAREKDAAARLTAPLEVFGTPDYMSPEQLVGDDVDERSDLWALAVCLYYTLTGAFPFAGETLVARWTAVSRHEFPAPSTLREGLPPALDEFFRRALAPSPQARFATAGALRDAFLDAASATGSMRALDRLEEPARPRRHPFAIAFATALVVVVGGAAVANAAGALPLDGLTARASIADVTQAAASNAATLDAGSMAPAVDGTDAARATIDAPRADAGPDAPADAAGDAAKDSGVRPSPFPLARPRPSATIAPLARIKAPAADAAAASSATEPSDTTDATREDRGEQSAVD